VKFIATRPHFPIWAQEVVYWVQLTREHGDKDLPANIYDTTVPGWQDR
jgi:hypothetical protein